MTKYIMQIWSADRQTKKSFVSAAVIEEVTEKAQKYGLVGTKLVLESNGTEICDDETLELFAIDKTVLIILKNNEEWLPKVISDTSSGGINSDLPIIKSAFFAGHSREIEIENYVESFTSNTESLDTTLSWTSGAVSDSSNSSEARKLFSSFKIPWSKLPTDILDLFEKKLPIGARINQLANIIIDELRCISYYIPMNIIRSTAQQVATKYPNSVVEIDFEGNVITTIPIALITKMKNRNNTLNRAPNKKSSFDVPIPLKQRKTSNVLQQTTANWQPSKCLEQNASMIEYKKQYLIELHLKEVITEDEHKLVITYMKEGFADQRLFLNNREKLPRIDEIRNTWPYLFRKDILYLHFEELMNKHPSTFKKNYLQNKSLVSAYFQNSRSKKIKAVVDPVENIFIFKSLAIYFNEDIEFLFKTFEFGTTQDDISLIIPTSAPWIAFYSTSIDPSEKEFGAYIFIEKINIAHYKESSFIEVLTELISYYYVLNLLFPKQISLLMEFLVRFFLKHYPDNIRGNKNNINNISKINTLIKKLKPN